MTEQKVSYRYAKAIIDSAVEMNQLESIKKDFSYFVNMLSGSKELKNLIKSPIVQIYKKKRIFEELLKDNTSPLFLNFVLLVAEKRRENLLFVINEEFIKIYNEMNGILPVTITTANPIDANLSDIITKKLHEWTGKSIIPEFNIDKSIKAGIKIKIDDWVFDASLKTRLQSLYHELADA
jgi:F-type H+-transporting ATPase subunit delta